MEPGGHGGTQRGETPLVHCTTTRTQTRNSSPLSHHKKPLLPPCPSPSLSFPFRPPPSSRCRHLCESILFSSPAPPMSPRLVGVCVCSHPASGIGRLHAPQSPALCMSDTALLPPSYLLSPRPQGPFPISQVRVVCTGSSFPAYDFPIDRPLLNLKFVKLMQGHRTNGLVEGWSCEVGRGG